jgi:site-specific DNA-methyltransferase (adenine-specific)
MSKYLTTEEAAEFLGVTPSRIRQLISEERIKSEKYGRDHLIQEEEVKYFAKEGRKKRGRPPKK